MKTMKRQRRRKDTFKKQQRRKDIINDVYRSSYNPYVGFIDEDKGYVKLYSGGGDRRKWYKNYSNRHYRRCDMCGECPHKKAYDLWWELY